MSEPNFNEALQQAKETIGRFADGSCTDEAKVAGLLWFLLDGAQISCEPLTKFNCNPRPMLAALELLEALKSTLNWLPYEKARLGNGDLRARVNDAIAKAEGK